MDVSRFKFTQRPGRFFENNETDFDVSLNDNKNTKRKTETDMRIFSSYLVSINESREPEAIPADELDRHLATYFSVIKKHDGNEYEPASLRGMLCSIERYLRSKNYPISLTRDYEFTSTRNMLKERQKLLRELSKTDKGTKSDIIALNTAQRLNQLYLAKEFGPHNPSAVINALCFAFVVHLKIRKAIDHKQLLWGDIVLKMSSVNEEYLCYEPLFGFEYCRLPLKGISGYKVLGQSPETSIWDPISIYKLYRLKRPGNMMTPESPFYLGISAPMHDSQQLQSWFKPIAMGVNKLNDLVRMIRDITGTLCQSPSHQYDVYETADRGRETTEVANDLHSTREVDDSSSLKRPHHSDENTDSDVQNSDAKSSESDLSLKAQDDEVKCKRNSSENGTATTTSRTELDREVIDDARKKILSVLEDLVPNARSEVIDWLKSSVCITGSEGSHHTQKESRKRIRLTLELDDLEVGKFGIVEKVAQIQVSARSKEDEDGSETNHQATDHSSVEDNDDDICKSPDKDTTQSSFLDHTDSIHRLRQSFFKRALSYPNDHTDAKLPKVQDNTQDDDPATYPHGRQGYVEDTTADRHTNVSTSSMHSVDTSTPEHNSDTNSSNHHTNANVKENVSEALHHVQGYNPYAAWALDPRFAMFMRNGFMQTYQDFVSMYSHPEGKDV